jgi:hypothetical protein
LLDLGAYRHGVTDALFDFGNRRVVDKRLGRRGFDVFTYL